jgi:tetratricopeptide (TPR) repeat protein
LNNIALFIKIKGLLVKYSSQIQYAALKNYRSFRVLKQLGAAPLEDKEGSLYYHAVYDFENDHLNLPETISLFSRPSFRKVFLKEQNRGNTGVVLDDLMATLNSSEKYFELRDSATDWEAIVALLWRIYEDKVYEVASPTTKMQMRQVSNLSAGATVPTKSLDVSDYIVGIAELRRSNHHLAVITALQDTKKNRWEKISDEQRYKLTLNLGLTYYDLHENKLASQYLLQLLDFRLYVGDTYGYAALGYAVVGNYEKSIEFARKALSVNSLNINAHLAILFSREKSYSFEEVTLMIPNELQNDPSILLNKGIALHREGRTSEAIEILLGLNKTHITFDAFKAEVLNHLGICYLESLNIAHLSPPYKPSITEREVLFKAKEKFTEGWSFVGNSDLAISRFYIVGNRATVNSMLGFEGDAISDYMIALQLKPAFIIFANLWSMYHNSPEKRSELIAQMEKLFLEEEDAIQLLLFKIEHFDDRSELNKILTEIAKLEDQTNIDRHRTRLLGGKIEIQLRWRNTEAAWDLSNEFAVNWPENPMGYFFKANIEFIRQDIEGAKHWLGKTVSVLDALEKEQIAERVAALYYRLREYQAIIHMLDGLPLDKFKPSLKYLMLAYLDAGNHIKAFELASAWRKMYPDEILFADVMGTIENLNGNYAAAVRIFENFLATHPGDVMGLYKLGFSAFLGKEYGKAVAAFDQLTDFAALPLNHKFQVAGSFIRTGNFAKGYELAYRWRIEYYQEPEVHDHYFFALTSLSSVQAPAENIRVVSVDTAVKLRESNGAEVVYVIVKDAKITEETPVNSFIAGMLMGKEIGSTVEIAGVFYIIATIISKYTWAFQESTRLMRRRFGNKGNFKGFEFDPTDDPETMRKKLVETMGIGREANPELEELNRQGVGTMGMNAANAGVNIIHYWYGLTNPVSPGVRPFLDKNEIEQAYTYLQSGGAILLDVTVLLIFGELGLLGRLGTGYFQILVGASTLELFDLEIEELKLRINENDYSVGAVGDRLVQYEITAQQKQNLLHTFEGIREWIVNQATKVDSPLHADFEKVKVWNAILGKNANDDFRIAREKGVLLVSDDRALRLHASASGIKGANTLILLEHLAHIGIMTWEELQVHFMELTRKHFLQVPVTGRMMLDLLIDSNYEIVFPFKEACDVIDPYFRSNSLACQLVVQFLYLLYQEGILHATRMLVADYVIRQLYMGRNQTEVSNLFLALLSARFHLMPGQLSEIIEIVRRIRG